MTITCSDKRLREIICEKFKQFGELRILGQSQDVYIYNRKVNEYADEVVSVLYCEMNEAKKAASEKDANADAKADAKNDSKKGGK